MDIKHSIYTQKDGFITIPPIDELCTILKSKFLEQEERNNYLLSKIKELENEKWKDKQLQEMEERCTMLLEDYLRGFPVSEEEQALINKWIDKHESECHPKDPNNPFPRGGVIGACYKYIFTPTSIGVFGKVKCNCGAEFSFREF